MIGSETELIAAGLHLVVHLFAGFPVAALADLHQSLVVAQQVAEEEQHWPADSEPGVVGRLAAGFGWADSAAAGAGERRTAAGAGPEQHGPGAGPEEPSAASWPGQSHLVEWLV